MGIFDDMKESMEKRKRAREYIQRAKELVREGNEIYELAYRNAMSYASETEYRLRRHAEYKMILAKELGSSISTTMQHFKQFDIDRKTITAPSLQTSGSSLDVMANFSCSIVRPNDFPSIFDFFASDDDYYEARRQRDEAREYKEQMKRERDQLNHYKERMRELRSFIVSEKSMLDSLMSKLRDITRELEKSMQNSSFTLERAEYLKATHGIAACIISLISTNLLSDSLRIDQRYLNAYSAVKTINERLPNAPSISDVNTATAIREILDHLIVY